MKISGLLSFLPILFILTDSAPCCADSPSSSCKASIYANNTLTQQADKFSVYETLYLKVTCGVLPKGSYIVNTQWIDENGTLQSERAQNFQVGFPRGHSAAFKFKQMPKGTLKRMLSSDDFDEFQYGRWSVLVFINNEKISRNYFTITN